MNDANWYVVRTKVRAEKRVNDRLSLAGFETYLPLFETVKIWSDRKKKVSQSLIASTLFVYTTLKELSFIYKIQGVSSILMFLKKPAVVQAHEINNLRILLQQETGINLEPTPILTKGESVEVIRGPFQGLIAKAIYTEQKFRVVVEIESLGSGFIVNVPKSYVQKLKVQNIAVKS